MSEQRSGRIMSSKMSFRITSYSHNKDRPSGMTENDSMITDGML